MSEENNDIKKVAAQLFPTPEVASKFVDMVVRNRPIGWSRKSIAPYYKEIYAKQIKDQIDKMLTGGSDLIYRYSVWCNDETKMSTATLYNRVNQSIRYLIENMDPDGIYARWYETVHVSREAGVGVVIRFIPGLKGQSANNFIAEEIAPKEDMPKWRREMEEWIESDRVTPFVVDKLALTPEEIVKEKIKFSQLTNIKASITSACIKLIRFNG